MHMISAISCLAGLAATVCASPFRRAGTSNDEPFQVTNLTLHDEYNANTTVTFNVYDPEPLAKAVSNATCTGSWPHGTDSYPQNTYTICQGANSSFAWNFAAWNGYQNFTLGIEHQFKDPAVGKYPYDQVTNFGRGPFNQTVLYCEGVGSQIVCNQKKDSIVLAGIYATIA